MALAAFASALAESGGKDPDLLSTALYIFNLWQSRFVLRYEVGGRLGRRQELRLFCCVWLALQVAVVYRVFNAHRDAFDWLTAAAIILQGALLRWAVVRERGRCQGTQEGAENC